MSTASARKTIIAAVLAAADKEKNQEEVPRGSNWGGRVSLYCKRAGYNFPVFWCAAFTYYCQTEVLTAEQEALLPRPGLVGSCDVWLEWAREHKVLHDTPEPGDMFLIMASPTDATHTGFVTSVGKTKIGTIEGNSNNDGSRNGYKVAVRDSRPVKSSGIKYVRWVDVVVKAAVEQVPVAPTWTVKVSKGRQVATVGEATVDGAGSTIMPARVLLNALKGEAETTKNLAYDATDNLLTWAGEPIPATPTRRDGATFASVRALAVWAGFVVDADVVGRVVTLAAKG